MANKTVLDFPEVTAPEDADVIYAIRGTSTGRDKRITWANLKQFLAPLAHAVTSTIYGVATATLYGHVRLNAAPISDSPDGVSSGGVYTAIAAEARARSTADDDIRDTLGGQISDEAIARANADSAEVTARTNADTALQEQITANAADIVKLYGPTSSTQYESADGNMVIDTEFVDGLCLTIHPGSTATGSLIQLGPAPADVQVFHVRVRLPRTDTPREYPVSFSYPSALDNNYKAFSDFVFPQKAFWGSDDHDQFTPVYTFVRGGTGWILM